jgi:hypothetical protein
MNKAAICDFRFAIRDLSVTPIFNLLYRRFATCRPTPADYKSAIRQIENLRYELAPNNCKSQI